MNKVNTLHNKAMDFAELGLIERMRGNSLAEADYARQALDNELAAIDELKDFTEPTFSVLHRSAATLALRCNEHRQAEKIAAKALAQDPPHEIAEELRDLIEQVNFHRHLALRGVELGTGEVQLSLAGRLVGYGLVTSQEIVSRIDDASMLLLRTVERLRKNPFGERGPRKATRNEYPVLVSVPRAASFAVTLRIGRPTGQLQLPMDFPLETEAIVDEFMDLMEMVNNSDIGAIKERIPEPAYRRNFLGLARKLAPDGDRVKQVGFTVERHKNPRRVSVTKPASAIPLPEVEESSADDEQVGKPVELRGTLSFADATGDKANVIKIVDDKGRRISVRVPEGMMNDVVRPMWDSSVIVEGVRKNRLIFLQDIRFAEAD